ncbi:MULTISPECIES: TetR/AcrR family transcriptional regulator [Streptomyces]|uniref:TetR/AcrR family transcriptional regulator n=1 Tax=Streptomyces prasinosporus TaxID=68256 RepID=A0ABP6TKP7_9ACTN|nr:MULTISPECIES: TetR/AcrR family transcriptional regulator [unclassified Streptomyces]NIL54432.1 TetR/AcrR family transcriptional regulator [Streptomyces sp. 2BBP-J2]GHB84833.1 TetR family transcriptional regulator [Streptomyces albogriseolus]
MTRSTRQGEGTKGTRQARSDRSREQILLAALDLALEHGYQGTTMAAVSASSGLPIGSVYWHFKSKEQLFVALLEHCHKAWTELHSGPEGLRRKLHRGIAGLSGADPEQYTKEEALLKAAAVWALSRQLGGLGEDNEVRAAYLRMRVEMFKVDVERITESVPADVVERFPDLPTKLTVLSLALTDGFYVHANSDVHLELDFAEYADMAARALEGLVDDYARRAAGKGQ